MQCPAMDSRSDRARNVRRRGSDLQGCRGLRAPARSRAAAAIGPWQDSRRNSAGTSARTNSGPQSRAARTRRPMTAAGRGHSGRRVPCARTPRPRKRSRLRARDGDGSCAGPRRGARPRARPCTMPVPSSSTTRSRTWLVIGAARPSRAGLEHGAREPGDPGSAFGVRDLEVAASADDAVEVVTELDHVPAEHPFVHRPVPRRVVREADPARPPARPQERPQHPVRDADRELGGLPHGSRPPDDQFLAQDDDLAALLDREEQRVVQAPAVADERLDRKPERRLLADQEPERTKVRELPGLGHHQAESLDVASLRRGLEKLAHRVHGDLELRLQQAAPRQPEFAQHARRDRVRPAARSRHSWSGSRCGRR